MAERIEVTAKTVEEATTLALKQLNTTRDRISVRIVDEGSKGLFGLGAHDAKIVVSLKDIETETEIKPEIKTDIKKEATKAAVEKKADKPSLITEASSEDALKEAYAFVTKLVANMKINCTVDSKEENGQLKVIITGDDVGTIIGRRGETLDAIQYITNLTINKGKHGDDYKRIILDTENYRAKREETLVRLANSMASKVVKYRKDMAFEPMNPYERRIIHATLQNHKYVTTRSVGDEPNRKIIVTLR